MKKLCKAIVVSSLLAAAWATGAGAEAPADDARAVIWAKEMAIYAGRAKGDTSYYVANTAPGYLAWTSGTPKPFRRDVMASGQAGMRGKDQERITSELLDFSRSGDTAIIYYRNHRTRMPDGTAVDQTYDNIHVWQLIDGDWKVLASMSRRAEHP